MSAFDMVASIFTTIMSTLFNLKIPVPGGSNGTQSGVSLGFLIVVGAMLSLVLHWATEKRE